MNMRVLKRELPTGTDAEACAYLNTASLTQPMGHDWTQIYLYIAGKTYTRWKKAENELRGARKGKRKPPGEKQSSQHCLTSSILLAVYD